MARVFGAAGKNPLYGCLDHLVQHKDEPFKFLCTCWGELFGAKFDVLLYDLTSTYFESDVQRGADDLRQYGYSRDKRPIAAGITPGEVLAKFKTMQMVDVGIPTTDGRELVLPRYTQPEAEHRMLREQLRLTLPEQPAPRITAPEAQTVAATTAL